MRESEYLEGNEYLIGVLKNLPALENFEEESIKKLIRFCKIHSQRKKPGVLLKGRRNFSILILLSALWEVRRRAGSWVTG
jgi:hypothetical protein